MPIHDWSKVNAGVFHHFHHGWVEETKRLLNSGVLPPDHYAMVERHASYFVPDVLTLPSRSRDGSPPFDPEPIPAESGGTNVGVVNAKPKARLAGETDLEFYRRK